MVGIPCSARVRIGPVQGYSRTAGVCCCARKFRTFPCACFCAAGLSWRFPPSVQPLPAVQRSFRQVSLAVKLYSLRLEVLAYFEHRDEYGQDPDIEECRIILHIHNTTEECVSKQGGRKEKDAGNYQRLWFRSSISSRALYNCSCSSFLLRLLTYARNSARCF